MPLDADRRAGSPPADLPEPTSRRAWLAATDDPASDFQVQGQTLVAALVDQLAAGQVETLHSLHTVAATVRRQTAELQDVVVAPVQQLDALLEELRVLQTSLYSNAVGVMGDVTTQLDALVELRVDQANAATTAPLEPLLALTQDLQNLQVSLVDTANTVVDEVTTVLTSRLEAMVDLKVDQANAATTAPLEPLLALTQDLGDLQASLADAAGTVVDAVTTELTTRLEAMVDERLSRASAELAASASAVTTAIDAAVANAVDQLAQATDQLDEATNWVEQGVQRAGVAAETAFAGFTDNLVAAGLETLEAIEHAGKSLLTRLDNEVESFLATLTQSLDQQVTRDVQIETDLNDRVRELVDRTDVGVRRLSDRLRQETDRLARRDEEQEHLRADSFANALETLLAQTDVRSPLRARIIDALSSERRKRDELRSQAGPSARPALTEVNDDDWVAPPVLVRAQLVPAAPAVLPVHPPTLRPVAPKPVAKVPAATKPAATKPAATKPAATRVPAITPAVPLQRLPAPRTLAAKGAARPAPAKTSPAKASPAKASPAKASPAKASPAKVVAARTTAASPVVAKPARTRQPASSKQETTP